MTARRILLFLALLSAYGLILVTAGTAVIVFLMDTSLSLAEGANQTLEALAEPEWWSSAGVVAAIVVAAQLLFLLPLASKHPPRGERSRPLLVSLVIGGAIAACLTFGLMAALLELVSLVTGSETGELVDEVIFDDEIVPLVMIAGSWALWSALLLLFARGIWADRALGRLVAALFGGTLVEALLVVPIDVMVRRRTDCYCGTGTFLALVAASFATLWLTGPGIVIVLASKRHRRWRRTHCSRCGHAMGPSPGRVCPECGAPRGRREMGG
jgi:hypothetical protein